MHLPDAVMKTLKVFHDNPGLLPPKTEGEKGNNLMTVASQVWGRTSQEDKDRIDAMYKAFIEALTRRSLPPGMGF